MSGQSSQSNLDVWRKFFRRSNCTIIDTIENAIRVAKIDNPRELSEKRDHISQILYRNNAQETVSPKMCQLAQSSNDSLISTARSNVPARAIYTGAGTSERNTVNEVLAIKNTLVMHMDRQEEESEVLELLKLLQSMEISMDIFKRTGIESVVNTLQHHKSRSVRSIVRSLMKSWNAGVNESLHLNPNF